MKDVVGAGSLIVAFCGSVIFVLILLENDTVHSTAPRKSDRSWPIGLGLSAAALTALVWLGALLAYHSWAPAAVRGSGCEGKTAGAEFWSWVVFVDSVALFLGITFFVATRLRTNRLGAIGSTAMAMLPFVFVFAVLLDVVNTGAFCGS